MIWFILPLLTVGVALSALFSGSETGFYRVIRIRLLLDGLGGDSLSRMLLRLTNQPPLFVATTLIGNNVANYITSLAIVLTAQTLFSDSQVAEMLAPLLLSPVIFVYCELLPKQLFFYAPNRLLHLSGTVLLVCAVLFAPVALILWGLGWLLEKLLGEPPLRVRLALASKELQHVLLEGKKAGILHTTQHNLAHQLFTHGSQNITRLATPINQVESVPLGATIGEALNVASRRHSAIVPVHERKDHKLVGYVRVIDLSLAAAGVVDMPRPFPRLSRNASRLGALVQMQEAKADAGLVEDITGKVVGLLSAERLTEQFLPGKRLVAARN
ncbi:MAG: CNNM domain-containing protein [Planctomycetota bacterium]